MELVHQLEVYLADELWHGGYGKMLTSSSCASNKKEVKAHDLGDTEPVALLGIVFRLAPHNPVS